MERHINRGTIRGHDEVAVQIVGDGHRWTNSFSSQENCDSSDGYGVIGGDESNSNNSQTSSDQDDRIEDSANHPEYQDVVQPDPHLSREQGVYSVALEDAS